MPKAIRASNRHWHFNAVMRVGFAKDSPVGNFHRLVVSGLNWRMNAGNSSANCRRAAGMVRLLPQPDLFRPFSKLIESHLEPYPSFRVYP